VNGLGDPVRLALVGLPAVGALTTLVVAARLTTWDLVTEDVGSVLFVVVFVGWALLPFAAAAAVGISVHRHWSGGVPVALVGGLALVALTVWWLLSVLTSDSSTAVIGLLFAPFAQAALVGATLGVAVLLARRRRAASAAAR
jgi:hypothetical protein